MRTRVRGRRLVAGVVAVAASILFAGSASGERSVTVGLSVVGNASPGVTTTQGTTVSLVARAAIRPGDNLTIAVTRGGETRLRRVSVCLRSPCTGRWTEQGAVSDRFQALVRRGSASAGRSRVVRVTWRATPPPPPSPPPGPPGHYQGRSTFNEGFDFDVSADGTTVLNLQTGQVNESCTPPAHLSGGNLTAPGPYPIAADGSFAIAATITIAVGDSTGTRKIAITGRFTGATATGTIRTDTTVTLAGSGYVCTSGDQTWSAARI